MIRCLLLIFLYGTIVNGIHFDGGTITWQAIDPTDNSSIVPITITQTYYWTASIITCATNVPISTNGRSSQNANLTCASGCTTDGGYSSHPVNILTDCQTVSTSMNLMISQRSVNTSLTADAHFSVTYAGSAWVAVNYPAISNLPWSMVCSIDLRFRPDGIINTAPVASIISPQYAVVNQTTTITIPVSDANPGDDVRCRWAVDFTATGRRKRSYDEEIDHVRIKRAKCGTGCKSTCTQNSRCCCPACAGTTCTGSTCTTAGGCSAVVVTVETQGTTPSTTSSSLSSQPVNECGGICYPSSVPTNTTLSGCTISFLGPVAGVWYGVALQVEDFINSASTTPMSSVPVQFLIYVMPQPACGLAPVMLPLDICLDVQVGVSISFNVSAMTLCNPNVSDINTIVVSKNIAGMNDSDVNTSPTNDSVSYATFTWTPSASQLGSQDLCVLAYSDERLQSEQYCVTFNVISSSPTCFTTTTTTITTDTTSTTSTSTTSISTTSASSSTVTITVINTVIESNASKQRSMWLAIFLPAILVSLCCSSFLLYGWHWGHEKILRRWRWITRRKHIQEEIMLI